MEVIRPENRPRWPSGRSRPSGLLRITPAELQARLPEPLTSGLEDGLGPWLGIGLKLSGGQPCELVLHTLSSVQEFTVFTDWEADPAAVCLQALFDLDIPVSRLSWVPDHEVAPPPSDTVYVLWHSYGDDPEASAKLLGVFRSLFKAIEAIRSLETQPGFRDYKDGFDVVAYDLDELCWQEGFISPSDAV